MSDAFDFILTPLDVTCPTPLEVMSGHWLQKAETLQINAIKQMLINVGAYEFRKFYEMSWTVAADGMSASGEQMQPTDWRYWIIRRPIDVSSSPFLNVALHLMEPSLEVGFGIQWSQPIPLNGFAWSCERSSAFSYFEDGAVAAQKAVRVVDEDCWRQVADVVDRLSAIERSDPAFWSVIWNYNTSRMLPRQSPASALALFGTIEALITHKPEDTYDSLTHQVSTKMVLLGKRFSNRLDYAPYLAGFTSEKLWKNLYGYRSTIAHGGTSDFTKRELKGFKDNETLLHFLHIAVRRLILYTLDNREFITDLQKC